MQARHRRLSLVAAVLLGASLPAAAYIVINDGIPEPLTAQAGDAQQGQAIVASRQTGLCLLCHSGPVENASAPATAHGNLSTNLSGAGARWTEAQLRLRVADARRLNPTSLMPSLHASPLPDDETSHIARAWRGKPVLTAQQVEDVVAYLKTLR